VRGKRVAVPPKRDSSHVKPRRVKGSCREWLLREGLSAAVACASPSVRTGELVVPSRMIESPETLAMPGQCIVVN
jgi:hypothetical protein